MSRSTVLSEQDFLNEGSSALIHKLLNPGDWSRIFSHHCNYAIRTHCPTQNKLQTTFVDDIFFCNLYSSELVAFIDTEVRKNTYHHHV